MTEPKPLPLEDEVLRRMLKTPPDPKKSKPSPTEKPPQKDKPASLRIAPAIFGTRVIDYGPQKLEWDDEL